VSRRRPVVHQFTAVLAGRDAVGQHTLVVDDLLAEMGAESEIFAAHVHPEVKNRGRDFRTHLDRPPPDLIIYQASIGSPVAEYVLGRPEPLVLNYHNMTPASFFDAWEPAVAAELDHGRRQLARLCRRAGHAIADSGYNAAELRELGMDPVDVAPVLFDGLGAPSSVGEAVGGSGAPSSVGEAVGGSGAPSPGCEGSATVLFVGRLSPNKCQQDLVAALAVLRGSFGFDVRLVLVGSVASVGFVAAVEGLAAELGVADSVVFAGSVSEAELAGWYGVADVFVCVSEHEGFCVPVVEAMGLGVPVVAFGAAAVPETLGGAGVVLADKSAVSVASAVARVLSDGGVREGLVARGRVRAVELGLEASSARMREVLAPLLEQVRP
jgi:L-malate glycosyltransferase